MMTAVALRASGLVRGVTLLLAIAHAFPATKHLTELWRNPCLDEAWKGLGAFAAVALFSLPSHLQLRLVRAVSRHRRASSLGAFLLAVAHLVPAADHLPLFLADPTWSDGWRGLGALVAVVVLAAPRPLRGRALAALLRRSHAAVAARS